MKTMTLQALLYAGVLLLLPNAGLAQKVQATTTTVTSSGGTISEFGAQGIVIKTEAGTTPVRYLSSETTNYVDENDQPVDVALIKSGLPATVHYSKVGDTLIASKVVVNTSGRARVPAKTTTQVVTTPATAGVITEVGPEGFIIKTERSPAPLRYGFTKTTTYVDESGGPVSIETVRPGVPVTVHSTQAGNGLVADKVIVRKSVVAPAPVIEQQTTTTTTIRK